MAATSGSQALAYEREGRGYRWLWSGVVALPTQPPVGQLRTSQEYPWHPLPALQPSKVGPNVNVRAPVSDVSLGRQEVPYHPPSLLWSGTQRTFPVVGRLATAQEYPWHPLPVLRPSKVGPDVNVRVPTTDSAIGRQETPYHPFSVLWAGVQGPNVRVPVVDRLATTQQLPDHPLPSLRAGVQGPNVRTPTTDSAVGRQEQPGHPSSVLGSGVQGPNVAAPPQIGSTLGRQQQPDHPSSALGAGVQALAPQPPVVGRVASTQQLPDHPLSALGAGVQGPSVAAPPQVGTLLSRQEQPWHPLPALRGGQLQGVVVGQRPPVTDLVLGRQEQPGHPLPFSWAGVQGPNVLPPVSTLLQSRQEQPGHPASFFTSWMPNVRRVVADVAIGRQEQPWHPTSLFSSWQPNIRRVVADTVLGRQEQPTHPPSLLQSGVGQAPVVPPLSQQPILVRQEQPWHPSPALAHWSPRVSFRPLLADTVLGRQEQPGHPSSSSWPGIYISRAPGQIQAPPLLTTQEFPWHPLPALRHWPAPPPPLFVAGRPVAAYADVRTVAAEPDVPEVGAPMQILALPQFTVAGPLDRDPYTMTFGAWLAGSPQPGDVIVSATSRVLNFDQTPQSSLQVISVAVSPSGTAVTTWLTGGVVGSTYQVDWIVSSLQSRYATKSANLQVVARRS